MAMPTLLQRVTVRLVCGRCRHEWDLCVAVQAPVPGPLRCAPSGGPAPGAGSPKGLLCPRCGQPCNLTDDQLRQRVEKELLRGRGRHVRVGAVVIDCR